MHGLRDHGRDSAESIGQTMTAAASSTIPKMGARYSNDRHQHHRLKGGVGLNGGGGATELFGIDADRPVSESIRQPKKEPVQCFCAGSGSAAIYIIASSIVGECRLRLVVMSDDNTKSGDHGGLAMFPRPSSPLRNTPEKARSEHDTEGEAIRVEELSGKEGRDEYGTSLDQPGGIQKRRRIDSDSGSELDLRADIGGTGQEGNILPTATIGPIQAASGDSTQVSGMRATVDLLTPPVTATAAKNDADSKMDVDDTTEDAPGDTIKAEEHGTGDESDLIEIDTTTEAALEGIAKERQKPTAPTIPNTPAPSSPAKSSTTSTSIQHAPMSAPATSSKSATSKPKAPSKKKASTPASASAAAAATSGSAPSSKKGSQAVDTAPAGGTKKGKGKGKTKVHELKASTKGRSNSLSESLPSVPTTPTRDRGTGTGSRTVESTPNPSPDKNAVYCICRKPYAEEEENITMLGCESCDNWFHPNCVGLTDEMVDLLDVYICKSCERNTHQRTIYKQVCKRDGCNKSVAGSVSKFCSPNCAFQHSHNLISGMTNKNTLKQLAKTFISYPPPQLGVNVVRHGRPETKPTHSSPKDSVVLPAIAATTTTAEIASRLLNLQTQIEQVERAMNLVKARQQLLESAIERCETLQPIALENGHDEAEQEEEIVGKRGKKKKGSNVNGVGKDDKPCGWVRLLVAEDQRILEWREHAGTRGNMEVDPSSGDGAGGQGVLEEGTCYNGRRKCDRHQGWQKTIAVSLEVELSGLERNHQNLVEYYDSLKSTTDRQQTSNAVRNEFLERKGGLR
ncbi:hypothetical protein I317_02097 [Kwoniella heveanensis CBS 569]|nr:hypothetical protein I317_02097 [Kwoniella heveanensis CBS 569]